MMHLPAQVWVGRRAGEVLQEAGLAQQKVSFLKAIHYMIEIKTSCVYLKLCIAYWLEVNALLG